MELLTMDTSNSGKSFCIYDLVKSDEQRENDQAARAQTIIDGLLNQLRPILKYMSAPLPVLSDARLEIAGCNIGSVLVQNPFIERLRGVKLISAGALRGNQKTFLFMNEKGQFFAAALCPGQAVEHFHLHRIACPVEQLVEFDKLVSTLNQVIKGAREKKEQLSATIKEREKMFTEVEAVIAKYNKS